MSFQASHRFTVRRRPGSGWYRGFCRFLPVCFGDFSASLVRQVVLEPKGIRAILYGSFECCRLPDVLFMPVIKSLVLSTFIIQPARYIASSIAISYEFKIELRSALTLRVIDFMSLFLIQNRVSGIQDYSSA